MAHESDRAGDALAARVDGIASWIHDLDERVRAAEVASGDERTARELRRAIEALSKHDPKLEKRLTNRVDVLADRLATLASTVSTAAASLARKDGEIATLRRDIEEGNKRVEAFVKQLGKGADADELGKLRSAVSALQTERPARSADSRLESLEGKIAFLTERIDTLAGTVATTAAGLVGREGEIANLRERLEQGSSRIEQAAAEIRRLQGSATLADRFDGLQRAVDETREGLADRERDVAALRGRIDEAYARVGTVVAEIQTSLSTLSAQVAGLESLPATTEQALDTRTEELKGRLDGLTAMVETVAQTTAGKDAQLELLGSVVAQLQEELASVPAAAEQALDARAAKMDARLDELAAALASTTHETAARNAQLERVETMVARLQDELATASEATEQALDARAAQLNERLAGLAATLESATQGVAERETALRDELAKLPAIAPELGTRLEELGERVEELAAANEEREDLGPTLRALAARVETTESGHTTVSAEVARIAQALDSERKALRAEFDRLAAAAGSDETAQALVELTARVDALGTDDTTAALRSELDSLAATVASASMPPDLSELTGRLEGLERAGASVAADVARTTASWAAELEAVDRRLDALVAAPAPAATEPDVELRTAVAAVEQRVDDLAGHLTQLASQAREPAEPRPSDDMAELQVAVDGLRMRLASSEQELATLVGSRDLATRIEELTRRVDAVERAPIALAPADGAAAGDGRFRLELRALELRMEHAEAAARENREAVLVQLERLAARIEWRFQRLEAEYEERHPQAVGGGRVVPLRPPAEV